MKTRNSKQLESFTKYCEKYPQQRFWQALRNWAEVSFIFVSDCLPDELPEGLTDTFYWEEKRGS